LKLNYLSDFMIIYVVGQTSAVGIFDKLTFTVIGFDADPEAYQQLADLIHDNGGVYFEQCRC